MKTTIKRLLVVTAAFSLSLAAFSSCSNDPTLSGSSSTGANLIFHQIDRVGNAGVTEVFSPYARHDASNRNSPSGDATAMQSDITSFVTGPYAHRSNAIANFIANLLAPDVLLADLSQSGDAAYLGVETNGQIAVKCIGTQNGGKFGGRDLRDDTVDITLMLTFGSLVPQIATKSNVPNAPGPIADDHQEQNGLGGTPQLTTDNVGCSDKHFDFTQFPYLGNPH